MSHRQILRFINNHSLMVISTLNSQGNPESAVVGFGETENLELIFGTQIGTRKAQNIIANENVSVVIGWDGEGTVQYEEQREGLKAMRLTNIQRYILQKYRNRDDIKILKVKHIS